MRKAGLRPIKIWVSDTRRAGFAEECRHQSLSLQGDAHERAVLDDLAALSDRRDWQ